MRARLTAKSLQKKVRVFGTGEASAASKNSSKSVDHRPTARHLLTGRNSENLVSEFLKSRGGELLASNLKTPFGEVDLLFRSPQGRMIMIEVKTLIGDEHLDTRVTRFQYRRLCRIHSYLSGCEFIEAFVVYVSGQGRMRWLRLEELG